MPSLLLHIFTCICVLTALACVSLATTETVVGTAGRRVTLPCRSEAVKRSGVEVCWGRGEPSLFTCHNILINMAGDDVSYRKSYRFSPSSTSSLSIFPSRPSDSGFYHCRVQLPGLFNDQTSTIHLIIISPGSPVSDNEDAEDLNAPHTATGDTIQCRTEEQGSDVTNPTEPMVALVQSPVQQPVTSLQTFIGNTLRLSFIIFIPVSLLAAAYRVWRWSQRPETDKGLSQSEEEEGNTSV
ncbi:hepatitis A virus cellular receptor 1 isoform X1 [Hippoglossus stenolepis]|uniref:hepatitis A virus cellular receptor 1 isoform X1 n=2 Tax=Hippoglossus stenolepis TaxID=195615 RepID=UPI001FAE9F2E|nr:hepatitis A virus cellular receptor 1 isoform X1 [Hippoglossus stenolepis]